LEIAISQFAPGSETVKESVVHTAVGVVDYQKTGNIIVESPNPLGPPIPVGLCKNCQAVSVGPGPIAQQCPLCGADANHDPTYSIVNLSQPKGFRTWTGTQRDYDGNFEWMPRATKPRIGIRQLNMTPVPNSNFELLSGQDYIYIVNDNAGQQFCFQKYAGPNS